MLENVCKLGSMWIASAIVGYRQDEMCVHMAMTGLLPPPPSPPSTLYKYPHHSSQQCELAYSQLLLPEPLHSLSQPTSTFATKSSNTTFLNRIETSHSSSPLTQQAFWSALVDLHTQPSMFRKCMLGGSVEV